MDAFGIINMNGRVYDSLTAMFFSPDPFVQAPGNWLNYYRYGYCMNNPTNYTDPTGYQRMYIDMPAFSEYASHWGEYTTSGASDWSHTDRGPIRYDFNDHKYQYANGDEAIKGEAMDMYGNRSDVHKVSQSLLKEYKNYIRTKITGSYIGGSFGISFDKRIGKYGHLKVGSKIENYKGIKGLTLIQYEGYDDGNGLEISLKYTGTEANGAYWAQHIITNYPDPIRFGNNNDILNYWDDYDTGNGRYYTDEQLNNRTKDDSVTFYDGPHRPYSDSPWFFSAQLYLFNHQNEVIFKIYYGFTVNGRNVTAKPITAITP